MDRRKFLSLASLAGLAVASTDAFGRPGRPETLGKNPTPLFESYKGPFYIMVNAGGGWDPTSLCDPKGAASAEDSEAMNRSYLTKDIGVTASGIRYAPLGSMENPNYFRDFFEKHDKELLILNGVDMATNGHDTGQVHTWSGRLANGYPSFAALAAAVHGRDLAMSYLSFGGYDDTQGLVARTRSGNTQALARIAYPDRIDTNDENSLFHSPSASKAIGRAAGCGAPVVGFTGAILHGSAGRHADRRRLSCRTGARAAHPIGATPDSVPPSPAG